MKRKFTLMANNSTNRTTTSHLKKFKKNTTTYGVGHTGSSFEQSVTHMK